MKLLRILKLVAKFGAYALVIFEIVEFAIDKITPLVTTEKEQTNE